MKVFTFTCGPLSEHPYLVIEPESGEALLVDPGGCAEQIIDVISKEKARLKFIVNTHFHPDHIAQNGLITDMTKAAILIHSEDAAGLQYDWSAFATQYNWPVLKSKADKTLNDGEIIKLGKVNFEVIHTPGHTPGSICLYCQKYKALFTGDTLFYHAIGRTDLPRSEAEQMKKSLAKLFKLPKDTIIYPGHGKTSTIAEEANFHQRGNLA